MIGRPEKIGPRAAGWTTLISRMNSKAVGGHSSRSESYLIGINNNNNNNNNMHFLYFRI